MHSTRRTCINIYSTSSYLCRKEVHCVYVQLNMMCICAFHQVPFVFIYFYIYFASLLTYFSSHSRLIPFIPSIHIYICVKCECIARAKSIYKNKNWKNVLCSISLYWVNGLYTLEFMCRRGICSMQKELINFTLITVV